MLAPVVLPLLDDVFYALIGQQIRPPAGSNLLLETGDALLMETGDVLLLES